MEAEGKLFFDDFFSAHAEAPRCRKLFAESGILPRVEKSPYGGYRIRMIPVDLMMKEPLMASIGGGRSLSEKNE